MWLFSKLVLIIYFIRKKEKSFCSIIKLVLNYAADLMFLYTECVKNFGILCHESRQFKKYRENVFSNNVYAWKSNVDIRFSAHP